MRELPPRPPPYRSAPVLRPYTETFSNCFGNVQRNAPASSGPTPVVAASRWGHASFFGPPREPACCLRRASAVNLALGPATAARCQHTLQVAMLHSVQSCGPCTGQAQAAAQMNLPLCCAYTKTFWDCFGNVQRGKSVAHSTLLQCRAGPAPGLALYGDDMSDAEMAQLVAAIEESERTAKQEEEARKAMQVVSLTTAFCKS